MTALIDSKSFWSVSVVMPMGACLFRIIRETALVQVNGMETIRI